MKKILFLTILLICALGVKAQDADPFSIENATESYTDPESGAVYHYFENYPIQYTIFSNPYETAPGWALTDGLQVKGHLTVPAEINGKPVIA